MNDLGKNDNKWKLFHAILIKYKLEIYYNFFEVIKKIDIDKTYQNILITFEMFINVMRWV